MKQFICWTLGILLLGACSREKSSQIETIDIASSIRINFSDLFSEYHLIFSESKDSAFFGLDILRIEKYDNRLYILNQKQSGKDILCFDMNGRFLFAIDRMGHAPGEYSYLGDFFIDTQLNALILTSEGGKWLYFDLNGNYLYSKTIPDEARFNRYTGEFNDSLYITRIDCREDSCKDIIFLDRKDLQIRSSIKSTTGLLADAVPELPISRNNGAFLYYGGDDIIQDISSNIGSKKPVYFMDFGEKQKKFKNRFSPQNNDESLQLFMDAFTNEGIKYVRSFMDNGTYLAINYFEDDSDNRQQRRRGEIIFRYQTLFYDPRTKKTYNTSHIHWDIFNSVTVSKMSLSGCFDGYFYAVIHDLFSAEDIRTMIKSRYLSEEEKQALLDMDDMSNPVILVFK
jgi:hypothetical protein